MVTATCKESLRAYCKSARPVEHQAQGSDTSPCWRPFGIWRGEHTQENPCISGQPMTAWAAKITVRRMGRDDVDGAR